MPGVLLCYSVCQAHRGAPLAGVLLCSLVHQAPKEAPGGGVLLCCSMCQALDGATVSIVQLLMLACGEREAMVMAPPPTCDSAVSPCFHGCLAFLHRHFPPQSPPSHLLHQFLRSQHQPSPWDCCTIPKLQLPAVAPSRGSTSLSGVCMAAARTI